MNTGTSMRFSRRRTWANACALPLRPAIKAVRCEAYDVAELAPGMGASASRPKGTPSAFAPHARPCAQERGVDNQLIVLW